MEELDAERSNLHFIASLNGFQVSFLQFTTSAELDLQETPGEGGGVDWRLDFLQDVPDRAGMIFMAVGDNDASYPVALVRQITKIGNDVVDSQHVILGEHDAGVDNQNVRAILDGHHIFADFPQTSQGNQPYTLSCH